MPAIDRRPRPRRHFEANVDLADALALMRAAGDDGDDWAAIRQRCIRSLAATGRNTTEQAARIFDAFRRRPGFIPGRSPTGAEELESG